METKAIRRIMKWRESLLSVFEKSDLGRDNPIADPDSEKAMLVQVLVFIVMALLIAFSMGVFLVLGNLPQNPPR